MVPGYCNIAVLQPQAFGGLLCLEFWILGMWSLPSAALVAGGILFSPYAIGAPKELKKYFLFLSSLDFFLGWISPLIQLAMPLLKYLCWHRGGQHQASMGKQEGEMCLCLRCTVTTAVMLWPSKPILAGAAPVPLSSAHLITVMRQSGEPNWSKTVLGILGWDVCLVVIGNCSRNI